jgi:predicted adenine nucleotide alpha hydrolase (AANH) superfamily ATPase
MGFTFDFRTVTLAVMRILLHICCGPCAIFPVRTFQSEGHELRGYYFNPNIHPYQEYQRRRVALEQLARETNLPVIYAEDYDLEDFLRQTAFRETQRCRVCYHLRLTQAAAVAKRGQFDAFTTTLLYSKFQKHDLIAEIGADAGRKKGIRFLYRDFRDGWREGIERSKSMGLYRQQYCGCVYSEKERFYPKKPESPPK